MRIHLLLVVVCALGAGVFAQNDPCRKPTSQRELSQCSERKFHMADDEMQKTYKSFLATLEKRAAPGLEPLKAAQQAWVTYRDLECRAESAEEAGELKSTMFSDCMETLTRARITQLNDTYGEK